VTPHAPLRSRWTTAESAYHVRLTGTGILSYHLVKIQGCSCQLHAFVRLVVHPATQATPHAAPDIRLADHLSKH